MDSRVVVVTKVGSALGVAGEHEGLQVADLRHPDAVESTLGAVHRAGQVPLVLCADEDRDAVRTLLTQARVRHPGLRGLLESLPGGPLAVGVLSSLVDDLRGETDGVAWQLNAIALLRERTWSATWLPSVAGLRDPSPRLSQHVASWFAKGFLVEHHPEPRVVRATKKAPPADLPRHEDHALLHSAAAQDEWVVAAVHEALGTQSRSEVTTLRDVVDAHGSARAIEFVAVPPAYHEDSRPAPGSVTECRGCGLRHPRAACPRCAMVVAPPTGTRTPASASPSEGDRA